jgi:hypothetical protein
LAETIASTKGTRLIYEPANVESATFTGERAATVPLPLEGDPATLDVIRALRTNLHGAWVDQLNSCHRERRRVVKDVRAIALAGDIHARVPDVPIVILMRHPVAVARSVIALGWTDHDAEVAFQREVTSWCTLHAAALADPRLADAHFVCYENLVTNPVDRLGLLLGYAGTFNATWSRIDARALPTSTRSSTDFRGASNADDFSDVPATWRAFATAQLHVAGLDDLYGSESAPLLDPHEVAARRRVHP